MSRSQRNRGNCFSFICCGCRLRTRDHNEKYLDLPKGWLRQDIMNSSSMEIDVFPNDQSIKIAGPLRCQADRKIACSLISKGALQTSNAQLDTAPTNFVIDSSGKKYRCHGSMSAAFKPVTNRSFRYERFAVTGDDLPSDIDVLIAMSPSDIRKLQNASEAHPSLPIFNNPKTKKATKEVTKKLREAQDEDEKEILEDLEKKQKDRQSKGSNNSSTKPNGSSK